VRGKAGAEVEFGSRLPLGESRSGTIADRELVDGNPRADTKIPSHSMERMKQTGVGHSIREVSGDRGFDIQPNRELLEKGGIYGGTCPKARRELKKGWKVCRAAEAALPKRTEWRGPIRNKTIGGEGGKD
jgi:hypothetical protein